MEPIAKESWLLQAFLPVARKTKSPKAKSSTWIDLAETIVQGPGLPLPDRAG